MSGRRSNIALEWVIGEIEETLIQAREAFNQYILETEDVTQLQFCMTYTHQILGSLTMVELPTAALLANEVELLLQALLDAELAVDEMLQQDMFEALLQLSAYLKHVKNQQQENPQILIALVDKLRAYRKADKVSKAEIFNPDLYLPAKQEQVHSHTKIDDPQLKEDCRKLRQQFQAAMVGLLRQQDEESNLQAVKKAVSYFYKISIGMASELLWQSALAAIESFEISGLQDASDVKTVLRKIDNELKLVQEQGISALQNQPDHKTIKVFLYPIAKVSQGTALIQNLQGQFQLKDFLDDNQDLSSQDLIAADSTSIESALTALNEELDKLQDSLDQTVRSQGGLDVELPEVLRRIANTLSVLGAESASAIIMSQRQLLNGIIKSGEQYDNETLMQIAEEIVQVRGALNQARSSEDARNLDLSNSHIREARAALRQEARAALETAKQQVVDYVASQWDMNTVLGLDNILAQVAAGLEVLELDDLGAIARGCQQFVLQELQQGQVPQWHLLDTLADALTSIEYYLECMPSALPDELDNIQQLARESVARLGVEPLYHELDESEIQTVQSRTPESSTQAADNTVELEQQLQDFDPEVIEIFVEEAAEVCEQMQRQLPAWQAALADFDVLQDIRRGFHTLKGSGRMVGANDLGELAWSIENMLNRVLDGGQVASEQHFKLVQGGFELLPDLVSAFEQRQATPHLDVVERLKQQAEALAKGESEAATELFAPDIPENEELSSFADKPEADDLQAEQGARKTEVAESLPETAEEHIETSSEARVEPGSEPVDSETSSEPDPDLIDVDAEVADIFVEEAQEVSEEIDSKLPQWQQDLHDHNALSEIRRGFHTLKGSGRMVNANVIAEMAWGVESLLNKVIDGALEANQAHVTLAMKARGLLPDLVTAFEQRVIATNKAEALALAEEAHSLAKQDVLNLPVEAADEAESEEQGLLSIFAIEAKEHLSAINAFVAEARATAEPIALTDALQRALHTLRGSASMAEVEEVVRLVLPLERLIKELRSFHVEVDELIVEVLAEGAQLVKAQLSAMEQSEDSEHEDIDHYIIQVNALYDEYLQAENARINTGDSEENKDAIKHSTALLLNGMEKLCDAAEIAAGWSEGKFNAEQLAELKQDLGNLQQIAEEAEFTAIGLLTQKLNRFYQTIDEQDLVADEAYIALAQSGHEALVDMMDIIATGQVPVVAEAVMQELQMAVDTYDAGSSMATELAEPETPVVNAAMLAVALESTQESLQQADTETLDIFKEEAHELIDEVENSTVQLVAGKDTVEALSALNRDLHTLKGGARLSELKALGDWVHDYETFLESADLSQQSGLAQLKAYQAGLRQLTELVLKHSNTVESAQPTDTEAENYDSEVLEIFLEEAADQQDVIETTTLALKEDPNSEEHLDEIKRVLHTLKGGARVAGVAQVADVAHEFESYLIDAEADEKLGGKEFNQALDGYQQTLKERIEQLGGAAKQLEQAKADAIAPVLTDDSISSTALQVTKNFLESYEKSRSNQRGPQEYIKVAADLLQNLVNLAGETSISRARIDERISDLGYSMEEMDSTLDRLRGQLRRLEIETEAQIVFRMEQVESEGIEGFDPLEMDRYSNLQQLARSLTESASDIQDVKESFSDRVRDMETLLLQQSRINTELQEGLMRSQMVPLSRMVPRLKRIVSQISAEVGKDVNFHFDNVEGELDRTVLERMIAPLEHMLRNAVDHGIEAPEVRQQNGKPSVGNITIDVKREGSEVVISIADDGAGIALKRVREKAIERGLMKADTELNDQEILQFILHAGFSTAEQVTQISGRGVGMDVVHSEIKQLGGSMDIHSELGRGTTFFVRLPFTVSVNRALMVNVGHDTYAIPLNSIEGIVRVSPYELEAYYQDDAPEFEYAGQHYHMSYMGTYLGLGEKPKLEGYTTPLPVILVRSNEHSVAIQVDRLLGSREIVVKSLGPQFSIVEGVTGATVLGDGSVVVILDLLAMIRSQIAGSQYLLDNTSDTYEELEQDRRLTVMVTDDSVTVRKVTSRFLERHGMDVLLAKDGLDAIQQLQELDFVPDLMLLDIEMPRMDGFEVASRVRHSDELKNMPIIMITSRTGEKHRERALSLGVSKYLGKPYQEAVLLEAIEELTGQVLSAD